ncbi:MAG: magnesium and cobalt transport protein CorA [Dysgonomonas sp.]
MAKQILRKTRHKKRSERHFLAKLAYQGENNVPTKVELIQYDQSQVTANSLSFDTKFKELVNPDKVNWFEVVGFSDVTLISNICSGFNLHIFDIKDLLSDQSITKVVVYPDITFILMSGFYLNDKDQLIDFQLGLILGDHFVVSLQETSVPIFEDVKKALIDKHAMLKQIKSDFFLYILLSSINGLSINTIMKIEDQLMDVEDQLMDQKNSSDIMNLLRVRRLDYVRMKRSIISMREEYTNLLHNSNKLIEEGNIVFFNDYDDKLRTAINDLDTCHELLTSLLDLYYNNNNMRLNEIMKRLTLVSTIFIPLTFMVGVWGMNFKYMPELQWKYGYLFSWGIFAVIISIACFFMKKKKWF